MLEGKRILVTGAATGIGRAVSLACAREGAVVGIHFHSSEAAAKALHQEIGGHLVCFDVGDAAQVGAGVATFREAAGGIDGLVNNAGVCLPGLLIALPDDRLELQIRTNLLGPIHCIRAVLPAMLEQRAGVILNLGSVAAARPFRGQAVYTATKGALESLTRAVAVEYARKGIRVHCLRPGPIKTALLESSLQLGEEELLSRIPVRRLGTPEEVAEMAVFLLSDRVPFATGSVHTVDGGYLQG